MKIGIYFTSTKLHGGIYQYSTTLLEVLSEIPKHKYVIFTVSKDIPEDIKKSKRFKIIDIGRGPYGLSLKIRDIVSYLMIYSIPRLMHTLYRMHLFSMLTPFYKITQNGYIKLFKNEKLDLMIFPTSANLSFLCDTPSIVVVHDIMHRVHPQFPEVSAGGRWESREYSFQNISDHAFRVLVDSEVGKEDMIKFYKTKPDKVIPMPLLPPSYLKSNTSELEARNICDKFSLPQKFIFYPAKFWPHKNHVNLIKAISILKRKGRIVNLVLTGSKDAEFSTYREMVKLIEKCNLEDQIFYLGYVTDEEISAIYKLARAMVMPDYFGPTNIPILEAWAMGTPAMASDVRGCRDQLGDAGLLVNPRSPTDIANKVWKIYTDTKLGNELSKRGKKRLMKWTDKDFSQGIRKMITDFESERHDSPKNN
jgi:glycosyltransferase involved in cell wall biosynthesis